MRPKSTEKTLIDLYRFKKYDYFEVKTYIEKWIDHFNVAGRYDYRINKERETLPDILEKSLLNGCIPKADRVSAKQIIHIPDIYVKFGATPEECLKFKIIDNIADSPLANLSEEKLKNLIDARYNHNSAKVTQNVATQNVATMQPEVIMDSPINTQATNAITPDLASESEFRIGSLTAELSQLYSSKWFAGKKWENALDTCVRTLVVKKEIDNSIIYYAFELAHKIVCENSYPISGTKIKIFLTFAENYAITLDSMIKVGVDECIALKKINAIAVSAMNLAIQEMNRNQRKSFSIEKYLHFYGTEYFRRKKHDPEIQSELVTVGKKDSYIDDGRPSLEQYILARTHMDPKTGLVYIQMPTGEAKSYTIEEIICKAIKGIDGYKDILERYKRIVVTTIQNKLIDPDAYMTKHGIYNLTQEEFDSNIVVVRGLLENLRKNFKRIKELTPIDIQGSTPFQQLEIAYNNLTTDPEIHKNWNTSSDIDLVDSKDGGNLQQELALAYGQLRKSVTGEGSSFFKAAEERAKSRHELTRADKDVSWTNLDPKERARLVRAEKSRLVVEDSDFEWMTLLWPSLLVPHRKVILSTVSKLQYPSFSFETDENDMNDLPYISWTKDAILFADEGDASKQYQEMAYIKNQSAEVYDLKLLLCRIYEQFDAALGKEKTDPRRIKDVWKRLSARYASMYNIRIRAKDGEAPNYIKNMEDLFQSLQKLVNTYHLTARFKSTSYVNKEMVTYVYAGGADFSTGGISSKAGKNAVFAAFYNKNGVVDIHRLTVQEGKSLEDLKKELLERYADLYDENSEINLRSMTAAMRKFAIDFAKQIHKLAIAYQDEYQEANSQKNKEGSFARLQMSERSAWRNVLRALGIDDEHHTCADFLRNLIPPILPGKIYGKMSPFYTYGWSATSLISDIDNQEDLRFWGFGVPTTAERILGTEATHGLVFCLSGTMDIESSISNYNRRELSKMLGSDYIASLSDDLIWKKHIEAELNDKWRPYYDGKINIHAEYGNWPEYNSYDTKDTDRDIATMHILKNYLHYNECAQSIAEIINKAAKTDYERGRLITFARLADIFIMGTLPAHLHFEKKIAETGSSKNSWSIEKLKQIFSILVEAKFNHTGQKENIELISLTSSVFNSKKKWNEIRDNRIQGQRQYLITAYATTGVGVNIESTRPVTISDDQVVTLQFHSKDDARVQKMDIPSLYLGPITGNHVPVENDVTTTRDEMQRFHETLHMWGSYEITPFETSSSLRTIRGLHMGAHGGLTKDEYLAMPGYRKEAEKNVHQAIGRILRGGCKNKDIFIYTNEDIGKILSTETPNKMLLPPEILSVYQAVFAQQKGVMDNPITYTYINRNMTQGGIYHKRVQRIVKRDIGIDFMHKAQINAYEILKEAVVSVYSSNDSEYDTDIYSAFQTPVSAYYYAKLRDYESCIVDKDADTVEVYKSIDPNHAKHGDIWKKQFETVSRVSEEMFRFDTLFAYPGMQEHFIENHMFTSCAPGRFVLCPEAANLARGVQGEVASKFILQKELGMIFHPIEDGFKYERFDVQLRPDVYIDFKSYKHGELLSFQMHNLISHAQEKAKKIQAKKVYIVNLIADEKSAVESYDTYTDNSVPIVYINGLIDASGHIIASHLAQFRKEDYERKEN